VARTFRPDAVILASDAAQDILPLVGFFGDQGSGPNILIVSAIWDNDSVVTALSNGVSGFLTSDSPAEVLVHALACVQEGEVVIPKKALMSVLK
jgi:DNA-binding NarL/FixJ family response regulator